MLTKGYSIKDFQIYPDIISTFKVYLSEFKSKIQNEPNFN